MGAFKTVMLASFLGLAACAPSQQAIEAASFSIAETDAPVELFSATCLKTLPDFKEASSVAIKRGLKRMPQSRGVSLYIAPGNKLMTAAFGSDRGKKACGVAFLGSSETAAVGALFLAEAAKHTGGSPKERLPSDFFQFVYHLRNGSVLTHDVRRAKNQIRHIVLMSPPIRKDQIAEYISN